MVSGRETERQMEKIAKEMGFKRVNLLDPKGEKVSNLELLTLLEKNAPERVPGILKQRSKSVISNLNQAWMLDHGYKIDFLWYSYTLEGYMGIDIQKYPFNEDWGYYKRKVEEINKIYISGLYNLLQIKRMAICLCAPLGANETESEEEEKEEGMLLDFLEGMEESKYFLAPTGIVDLRERKEYLPPPPKVLS